MNLKWSCSALRLQRRTIYL